MLIEFRVENLRSLREEQVLTMGRSASAMTPAHGLVRYRATQKACCPWRQPTVRIAPEVPDDSNGRSGHPR